jgi:hypothetical protein
MSNGSQPTGVLMGDAAMLNQLEETPDIGDTADYFTKHAYAVTENQVIFRCCSLGLKTRCMMARRQESSSLRRRPSAITVAGSTGSWDSVACLHSSLCAAGDGEPEESCPGAWYEGVTGPLC